jgi:hypothetical protein
MPKTTQRIPKNLLKSKLTNATNAFVKKKIHTCSICMDDNKKCIVNHCTTCKGRDKMVCRGCILKMTKLDEDLNLCYKCPYCCTKKMNDLLRKKLQGNSIVESLFSDSDSDSEDESDSDSDDWLLEATTSCPLSASTNHS